VGRAAWADGGDLLPVRVRTIQIGPASGIDAEVLPQATAPFSRGNPGSGSLLHCGALLSCAARLHPLLGELLWGLRQDEALPHFCRTRHS